MNTSTLTRSIGLQVQARRKDAGLTQKALAEAAGVSERLVRSLEMGRAQGIGLEKLVAILNCLGIDLNIGSQSQPDIGAGPNTPDPDQALRQREQYESALLRTIASFHTMDGGHLE